MSIKVEYFDYLAHFGETLTLSEYSNTTNNAIALRHDIDHSIDVALEMAYWESSKGIKATYFILDTAQYFSDPRILEKCYQIQEFGHEVGIHLNSITRWFECGDDPYSDLKKQLLYFREAGIKVLGTSAHGDRSCYDNHFINYWLFKDLKGAGFLEREAQLNAEGVFEPNDRKRVGSPVEQLVRPNGDVLKLWNTTQEEMGLAYEASHLEYDEYYSDSGGSWKRSPNPLNKNLRNKRVQILMHPIHWRGPRKIYFFLSTARSGSKWLATMLDQASSCTASHEYTLNHYGDNDNRQIVSEKMTGDRLHELLADDVKIAAGLKHTRKLVDHQESDFAEVNVYLPLIVKDLKKIFPDARIIHLHRNLTDVVRSVMNRGWYDTPYDTSHPLYPVSNWEECSPFEKCCIYVKSLTGILINETASRIKLENATTDAIYLNRKLNELGIAFYPHLSRVLMGGKINENNLNSFPSYDYWDHSQKEIFENHLSMFMGRLGYKISMSNFLDRLVTWSQSFIGRLMVSDRSKKIFRTAKINLITDKAFTSNLQLSSGAGKQVYNSIKPEAHSYILLNGGSWSKLGKGSGWPLKSGGYYTLSLNTWVPDAVKVHAFCLYYDENRRQVYKRSLGGLEPGEHTKRFTFASMANASFFNLSLYLPIQSNQRCILINEIDLSFHPY
jgi:hypothetical protein